MELGALHPVAESVMGRKDVKLEDPSEKDPDS